MVFINTPHILILSTYWGIIALGKNPPHRNGDRLSGMWLDFAATPKPLPPEEDGNDPLHNERWWRNEECENDIGTIYINKHVYKCFKGGLGFEGMPRVEPRCSAVLGSLVVAMVRPHPPNGAA